MKVPVLLSIRYKFAQHNACPLSMHTPAQQLQHVRTSLNVKKVKELKVYNPYSLS